MFLKLLTVAAYRHLYLGEHTGAHGVGRDKFEVIWHLTGCGPAEVQVHSTDLIRLHIRDSDNYTFGNINQTKK